MTAIDADARLGNWQYAVPSAENPLLLPAADERLVNARVASRSADGLASALGDGPFDGVAAPDLGGWSVALGRRPGDLLASLVAPLADGGWIYVGLTPPWSPLRFRAPGAFSFRRAKIVLAAAGIEARRAWFVLPSLGCPAFLIPADRPGELDYFLSSLFFPYVQARSALSGKATQVVQRTGKRAVVYLPNAARVHLAPAVAVLGVRS
jgi:hypothetical protein